MSSVQATVRHSRAWQSAPDPVAVSEALNGRAPRLVPYELRQVVAVLTGRGWSTRQIALHAGCSDRAVTRHRKALRATNRQGN